MADQRRSIRLLATAAVLLVAVLFVGNAAAVCVTSEDCGVGFDPCLRNPRCVDGGCEYDILNCDDSDPCTLDPACNHQNGCEHPPTCPDDGLVCNGEEECCTIVSCLVSGVLCKARNVPNCDDDNACTVDSICTEPFGCSHTDLSCDDGNPCTTDSCDLDNGCVHEPVPECCRTGADCAGDACITERSCVSLTCTAGTTRNCDDGDPCTTDSCDSETGCLREPIAGCGTNPLPAGACRSDADCSSACVTGRTCAGGTCTAGSVRVCDDSDPCTVDSCDATSGCITGPLAGFDVLACVCGRSQPASCTGQPVPKSLTKRFGRACASIERAKGATGMKRTKLVTRAVTQFTKATKRATRSAGHDGLSETCGTALAERFTDNRARAIAVRSQR